MLISCPDVVAEGRAVKYKSIRVGLAEMALSAVEHGIHRLCFLQLV